MSDGEIFPACYQVIRKDRLGDSGWGGVLLAVRDIYTVRVIKNIDGLTPDKELIFAIVSSKMMKFLCCVVYLPPSYNDEKYLDVLSCVESAVCAYSNMNVLILGDFNLNSCSEHVKTQFDYFCDFCNLQQYNTICNFKGSMLDLVLSDYEPDQIDVSEGLDPLVPIDNYHPSLDVTLKLRCGRIVPQATFSATRSSDISFNWRKANFQLLYEELAQLDWSDLLVKTDVDSAVDYFYTKLYEVIRSFVPPKKNFRYEQKYNYPKWYTPEIIQNIKFKYFHLKRYKSEGKEFNRELFKYYRWKVKSMIDNAYKQHLNLTKKNIVDDPVKFWEYIRDKKRDRQPLEAYSYKGQVVTGQAAADAFAEYFSSVFQKEEPLLCHVEAERTANTTVDATSISLVQVGDEDFRIAVKRLKVRSAGGPDNIPAFLVKDCASALRLPLLFLFNLSLHQAKYPDSWKLSRVTPVPKGESGKDVTSFRPIAVLSVLAKLFETILNYRICQQISKRLHNSQHGFRKGRSTDTNLVAHVDYICSEMDAGRQVDAAYFDFRKAFDLVHNDILLTKLAILGFTPKLLQFFASYLKNRRQFVRVDGSESNDYYTRSGVSQGSTLGPTLFLIFINDLPNTVGRAKCLLFADDLKLSLGINTSEDAHALQRDINAVSDWSRNNRLPFNETKCKIITFAVKRNPNIIDYKLFDAPMERVSDIRDLGLILDSKLNFHKHVNVICKAASKMLGFVIRTSADFDDIRVAKILYNAFVRSKLEYGAVAWNPYQEKYSLMIERIQRKFARWLYKKCHGYYPYLYPSQFVLGMVEIETLKARRVMATISHYLSILRGRLDCQEIVERVGLLVPRCLQCDETGMVAPRRKPRLIKTPATRTQRASFAPTNNALRLIGDIMIRHDDLDLFADGIGHLLNQFNCIINGIDMM